MEELGREGLGKAEEERTQLVETLFYGSGCRRLSCPQFLHDEE
jgi:hypothetical protein